MTTITITINCITHRRACLDGLTEADAAAYDERAVDFFRNLGEVVRAAGFEFELDNHGQGTASYRVDAEDYADVQRAHDFIQNEPAADFWAMY